MATSDVTPVVDRLALRIGTVPDIGMVWPHDIYAHNDLRPMVVSTIAGADTMRAWWITGPTMRSQLAVQAPGSWVERTWSYTIHGIEGLTETGDSIVTLRNNALAVIDAIDIDPRLGGTVHRSQPCEISQQPQHRVMWAAITACYVAVTKTVVTLSTP